jgi:hypothetical protein
MLLSEFTLKRSGRGSQFFAHKAVGGCSTAPVTEAHLLVKRMALEAAMPMAGLSRGDRHRDRLRRLVVGKGQRARRCSVIEAGRRRAVGGGEIDGKRRGARAAHGEGRRFGAGVPPSGKVLPTAGAVLPGKTDSMCSSGARPAPPSNASAVRVP